VAVCDGENADTKLLLAIAVDGDGEVRSWPVWFVIIFSNKLARCSTDEPPPV
jgi:hypothetical protein